MVGYIYSLDNKDTKDVLYIGSTINLKNRLCQHETAIRNGTSKIHEYIRDNDIIVEMTIVEEIIFEEKGFLLNCQKFWIEQFRQRGFSLFNVCYKFKSHHITLTAAPSKMNVAISSQIHELVISFCKDKDLKVGKFVEKAIKEKITKETMPENEIDKN